MRGTWLMAAMVLVGSLGCVGMALGQATSRPVEQLIAELGALEPMTRDAAVEQLVRHGEGAGIGLTGHGARANVSWSLRTAPAGRTS